MSDIHAARRVGPGEGEAYSVMGDRYVIKLTGDDTGGSYALFEFFIPPGNGSPPHVHHREEEGFQILEGELTFFLGPERQRLAARPGDYVHAPRDVPHFFRNEGAVPVRCLAIVAPAGLEHFFAEVGVRLPSTDAPPVPPPDDQMERILAMASWYGLEILGPPPWLAKP